MSGYSLRKLLSLLLILVGANLVSTMVDITPVIGSPQIDYPGFDYALPFWPQLSIHWVLFGLGGGLLTTLALVAWSDEAIQTPTPARLALVWASCFAVISAVHLAGFMVFGTMGPLHVQQPIFRFALTNGLMSATLIAIPWLLICAGIARFGRRPLALKQVAGAGAATAIAGVVAVILLSSATGLPVLKMLNFWWPAFIVLSAITALLLGIYGRGVRRSEKA